MRLHRTTGQELWRRALAARRFARTAPSRGRRRLAFRARIYLQKMRGLRHDELQIYPVEILWSFVGSFAGIGLLSLCHHLLLSGEDRVLLLATFGASAMLLFGAPSAAFSQPRNVIGGHVISALVGVAVFALLGPDSVFSAPLAVALAIVAMSLTGTLHPPGGGTALLMVTGGPAITRLGYAAAFFPVGVGALLLVLAALVTNNLSRGRRYPLYWW